MQTSDVPLDVLTNDSDLENGLNPATLVIVTPPQHGTANANTTTGEVDYQPFAEYSGPDSFEYGVSDYGDGNGNPPKSSPIQRTATATINVYPVNDPPSLGDDFATVLANGSVNIDVLANDQDKDGTLDPSTVVLVGAPPAHANAKPR